MRRIWCALLCLFVTIQFQSHLGATAVIPAGRNTTLLEGTTWCVAVVGVSHVDVQNALDWACGVGQADCTPIQNGGPCYQQDNILLHASYAFNSYYQQNANSDVACNFGGTATITKHDPSYEKCSFAATSGTGRVAASGVARLMADMWNLKLCTSILLLYHIYMLR